MPGSGRQIFFVGDFGEKASWYIARWLPASTLVVNKQGTGSGTVTSDPAGIDCGNICEADFSYGTAVTLAHIPSSGSVFVGWNGACTGTGNCIVTIDRAKNVTASFDLAEEMVYLPVAKRP